MICSLTALYVNQAPLNVWFIFGESKCEANCEIGPSLGVAVLTGRVNHRSKSQSLPFVKNLNPSKLRRVLTQSSAKTSRCDPYCSSCRPPRNQIGRSSNSANLMSTNRFCASQRLTSIPVTNKKLLSIDASIISAYTRNQS